MRLIRLAVAGSVGGLVGLAAESVHQHAGVWEPSGSDSLPVWIVAAYAVCLFAGGWGFSQFERRHGLRVSRRRLALEAGLFGCGFLAPVVLHEHEWSLFLMTSAYLAGRLRWGRERGDWEVVVFVMIFDLVAEGALVAASMYHYPNAHYLPLPLWLAPLWGGLAFGLRRFFCALTPGRRSTA